MGKVPLILIPKNTEPGYPGKIGEEGAMDEMEFFRAITENSVAAVSCQTLVFDGEGRPVDYTLDYVNPEFEAMTGLNGKEILGKRASEVIPYFDAKWLDRYGRVALEGDPIRFEDYVPALGKWFEGQAFRHRPNSFTTTFLDVTRHHREQEAKNSIQQMYQVFFEMGAAKLVIDVETGAILDANKKAQGFYGYTLEQLQTRTMADIGALTEPQAPDQRREFFFSHHQRADGQEVPVEVHSSPAQWNGKPVLFSIIFDHTPLEILRKELVQSEKLAVIGSLTASLYHEYGNLISVFSSHLQLLERVVPPSDQTQKILNRMSVHMARSQKLVDSVKRVSRNNSLVLDPMRIGQVVEDIVALVGPTCSEKQIRIQVYQEGDDRVEIDVGLFQQVLLNIVRNAIYALAGVEDPRIDISIQCIENRVHTRISNNGAPIPPGVRARLFTEFFTTKTDVLAPGSGLGLSFSRLVIERHGGTIGLEDQERTSFLLVLPVAP